MKLPVMTVTASSTTTTTTATTTTSSTTTASASSATNNSSSSSSMSSTVTTDPKLRRRPSTMSSSNRTAPNKSPLPPPTTPTPRVAQRPLVISNTSNPSLHPNVTTRSPRPAARKPRADTVSANISQLHIPSRPPSAADDVQRPSSATGSRLSMRSERSERSESRQSQYGATSPMFFRAGDARGTKPASRPALAHQPSNGKFFFANSIQPSSRNSSPTPPLLSARPPGVSQTSILSESPSLSPSLPILSRPESRPGSSVGVARSRPSSLVSQPPPSLAPSTFPEPRSHVKFVYANGTEEVLEPRGSVMSGGSEIGGSGNGRSEVGKSEVGRGSESGSVLHSPQVVPGSPNMTHFPLAASPTKSSPASPGPITMPSSPFHKPTSPQAHSRRTSLEGIVARHGRTLSISSIIDMADLLEEEAALVVRDAPEVPETPAEKYARRSSSPPAVFPAAPVMSAKEKIAAMEEAAAKARRERKVLDLEISNASLLAINKTLERQLKKQTAELRRYRRLSRSGRLPVMPKRRKFSKAADPDDSEGYHVREESEREVPEAEREEDLSEEEEEEDSDTTGDGASDEKDKGVEDKRLTLDLTKHQELLDNSAKMNVSLKRCQFIADQLINEAKKALEYKIRPSDVHLGGRVLDHDAEETDLGTETDVGTEDDRDDQTETEDGEDYDDDDEDSEEDEEDDLEEMDEIHLPDLTGMGKSSTLYLPTPLVQTVDGYV